MITVKKIDANTFEVAVKDAVTTTHQVSLPDAYYEKLTGGGATKEKLIEESFKFLLERESNTMIFTKFDLPVIMTYFSDFEKIIKNQIQ